MVKLTHFMFLKMLIVGLAYSVFIQGDPPLKYMQVATIKNSIPEENSIVTSYNDTLTNDSIYLLKSYNGIPLYYYKAVTGEVCFDEKCRLLDIIVYWNITGRYLGFELPKEEFLSKQDHEPFSASEYQRLHTLLADSSIPLDEVSFEKLIDQPNNEKGNIDGISGATSKNVAEMVVKGAAYTTYKLWNVVNGPTMDFVSELTEKQLTPNLIHLILQSSDITDRLWALNRIGRKTILTPDLEASLLEIISSDDFYLAYSAINALNSSHLKDTHLQEQLFSIYKEANHSIQNELLKKLEEAPDLSSKVVYTSRDMLHLLNGQQLDGLLKLYTKHSIADLETCKSVAIILENENKFISKKAYEFLFNIQTENVFLLESLKAYKNKKE